MSLTMNLKNLSFIIGLFITFSSTFIYIGNLQGKIASQENQIASLQKNKLDIAVYESDMKRVENSLRDLKETNNREHEQIMTFLIRLDTKIDKR